MHGKRGKKLVFHGAILEGSLLLFATIAFAFLIAQAQVVDAQPKIIVTNPQISKSGGTLILGSPSTRSIGLTGNLVPKPNTAIRFEHGALEGDIQRIISTPNADGLYPAKIDGHDAFLTQSEYDSVIKQGGRNFIDEGTARAKIPLYGEVTGIPAHLVKGIGAALIAVSIIQLVGNLAGFNSKLTNALSVSAGAGIIAGKLAYGLVYEQKIGTAGKVLGLSPNAFGIIVGAGIAAVIFFAMYKKEERQLIRFECLPWEAPLGGAKCDQCNNDPQRPCTEYRCRALGQACSLLNAGTGKEQCAYVSVNDAKSPIITPWQDALSPGDLKYQPDNQIRPPAVGVKIISTTKTGGCLPAYTPLKFGVSTDEPAQCKMDFNTTTTFDQMQFFFGGSNLFEKNHTQSMRLPSPDSASLGQESPLLQNGGKTTLFVRCRDSNGNFNPDAYAISFCVDSGPDTTPPIIEGFSIPSGSFVQYNQDKSPIEVYVNEPSECKWSIQDKDYETMENKLKCASEAVEINANLQYVCKGELTGIKNREENNFYFKCKDNPNKQEKDRNSNLKSTPLILKGSQPLTISSSGPNETIKGSTDVIKVDLEVTTTNGAEEGKATCLFSDSPQSGFIKMFESGDIRHKQTLTLTEGEYSYSFRCIDAGGNIAESTIAFAVKVDKQSPKVTRAYRFNAEALRIITDEDATCVYSLTTCNYEFDRGIAFVNSPPNIKNAHLTEWKGSIVYHIKCEDIYGNQPDPAQCSLIASASHLSAENNIL